MAFVIYRYQIDLIENALANRTSIMVRDVKKRNLNIKNKKNVKNIKKNEYENLLNIKKKNYSLEKFLNRKILSNFLRYCHANPCLFMKLIISSLLQLYVKIKFRGWRRTSNFNKKHGNIIIIRSLLLHNILSRFSGNFAIIRGRKCCIAMLFFLIILDSLSPLITVSVFKL